MKIALISDIHGNYVALQAVLADVQSQKPDQIVCLGDVAATGPQPSACLARVRELGCPVVMGNTDAWLLEPNPWDTEEEKFKIIQAIDDWNVAQLSPEDLEFLQTFQPTVAVSLGNGVLLCFHGSPHSFDDQIVATTSEDELAQMLDGFDAQLMSGGHMHAQLLRRHKDTLFLNPGSVGLPYEKEKNGAIRNPPWAEYALIEYENEIYNVTFRRVPVDLQKVIEATQNSGMPHADWWIQDWR